MKISVTIPTYKRPKLLYDSVKSVWNQSRMPDEILIGDDSPDLETYRLVTESLIPPSPIPIRYFHNKTSLGEAKNVDRLFMESSGDLILHMHDDDPVFPNCIELLAKPMEHDPEIVASFGLQSLIAECGEPMPGSDLLNRDYLRTQDRAGRVDGFIAGATCMFPNNGFIVRADVAKKIGYDDNGRAGYARDFYFGFRLGRLGKPFYFVSEYTAKARITKNSESRNNPKADNAYRALTILLEDLTPEDLQDPYIVARLQKLTPVAISIAIRRGERVKALGWQFSPFYRKAIRSPFWWCSFCRCFF